ncbi:hypothetical protein, partial [Jatrophihabitans sp.]|uniref:hypothetical protein n=1 Tax=Jatrophihabitans sp. TaxID=1932789 RepID=UPI0030C73D4F
MLEDIDKAGRAGTAAAAERFNRADNSGSRRTTLSGNQRDFLSDYAKVKPNPTPKYSHPAETAGVAGTPRTGALTPAQVTWLSRLPTDPTQIPYQDAQTVFSLLTSTDPKDPAQRADLPLLRSVADPLRAFHDRNAADAELEAAQTRPDPIPS